MEPIFDSINLQENRFPLRTNNPEINIEEGNSHVDRISTEVLKKIKTESELFPSLNKNRLITNESKKKPESLGDEP